MITYDTLPRWRKARWVGVGLVVMAGLAASLWMWSGERGAPPAQGAVAPARSPLADAPQTLGDPLTAPAVGDDGRPADFSPGEWKALKEAMTQAPDPQAELQRVVAYLRFQRGVAQWQSLQDQPDSAQRHRLGRALLTQLPERVRQGEVTPGEAMMLGSALWADLEPDDDQRKIQLEALKGNVEGAVPVPDEAQQAREAALLNEYKRREAAIVADWQARPAGDRSQARLEEALEAARRAVYDGRR